MKRSRSLSLLLMGSLTLGPVSGCGSEKVEETFTTFSSVEQCISSGLFSDVECRDFALEAISQTPLFTSQAECEAQYGEGQCEAPAVAVEGQGTQVTQHSGSMWMPMMLGFMAGRFMGAGGPVQGAQGLYRNPGAAAGSSQFRTATGNVVSTDARGRVTGNTSSLKQSMSHTAKPVSARGSSASRGGFSGGSKATGAGS